MLSGSCVKAAPDAPVLLTTNNMRYIIDSSVVTKMLCRETQSKRAREIGKSAVRFETELIAPSLMIYEVNHSLIRKLRKGMREATYRRKVDELRGLIRSGLITLVGENAKILKAAGPIADLITPPNKRPWSYDGAFHALAIHEQAPLLTADYKYVDRVDDLLADETDDARIKRLAELQKWLVRLDRIDV